jgi:hemerythrin
MVSPRASQDRQIQYVDAAARKPVPAVGYTGGMRSHYPNLPHEDLDSIEAEHRVQVGMIDALLSADANGLDASEVDEILLRLLEYTRLHFLSEELLMRLHAYEHHDEHVFEHRRMLDQLEEIRKAHQQRQDDEAGMSIQRLRARLLGHIHSHDAELTHFIARR